LAVGVRGLLPLPHLDSLADLVVDTSSNPNLPHHLEKMIARAPNLVSLDIWVDFAGDGQPLVAAMASVRSLTTLKLSGAVVFDTEVTVDWQCPLSSLDLTFRDTAMTLPTFRTLVSRFSPTLQYLTIQRPPTSWSHHPTQVPLPLPHLVRLVRLRLDYEEFMPSFISLPSLFVNSPIKNATLRHDPEVSTNDHIATCAMAMQFIEGPRQTLRMLTLSLNDGDNQAERLAPRDLDVFARTSGIQVVLEGIGVRDNSGDEGSGWDEWEVEEGEEDIEDEEEEVGG
jgi:hypothetical protein